MNYATSCSFFSFNYQFPNLKLRLDNWKLEMPSTSQFVHLTIFQFSICHFSNWELNVPDNLQPLKFPMLKYTINKWNYPASCIVSDFWIFIFRICMFQIAKWKPGNGDTSQNVFVGCVFIVVVFCFSNLTLTIENTQQFTGDSFFQFPLFQCPT